MTPPYASTGTMVRLRKSVLFCVICCTLLLHWSSCCFVWSLHSFRFTLFFDDKRDERSRSVKNITHGGQAQQLPRTSPQQIRKGRWLTACPTPSVTTVRPSTPQTTEHVRKITCRSTFSPTPTLQRTACTEALHGLSREPTGLTSTISSTVTNHPPNPPSSLFAPSCRQPHALAFQKQGQLFFVLRCLGPLLAQTHCPVASFTRFVA